MSTKHTPGGIRTGEAQVYEFKTQPEFGLVDGPLDAPDYIPGGAVIYMPWGDEYKPSPGNQSQVWSFREAL